MRPLCNIDCGGGVRVHEKQSGYPAADSPGRRTRRRVPRVALCPRTSTCDCHLRDASGGCRMLPWEKDPNVRR
jgi:hypothetical protein